jgi:biotin carboxylase
MNKKLLFIESNTTGTGMLALRKARELGYLPVMITNNPNRYAGLKDIQCEVFVCNTNSIEELTKFIDSKFLIEDMGGITTTSEFYIEIVAILAMKYNLPGNSPEAIKLCRDKSKTRATLTQNGIFQPKFAIIDSIDDIDEAMKIVGAPCVVKPTEDSGSNNVLYCTTYKEAKEQIEKILNKTVNGREQKIIPKVLTEEYLNYPEYSVEMFTWQNKSVCIGITEKKLTGFPYFIECGHIFPANLKIEQQEELEETVSKALKVLGITYGPTHTEIKITPFGGAIIEVNARLAGGMIPELIRYVTDIDMLENQIKASLGISPNLSKSYSGYAGIKFLVADKKGTLKDISGVEEASMVKGVKQVTLTCEKGKEVSNPRNAYDRLGFIIATSSEYDEVKESLQEAVNKINTSISTK